MNLLFDGGFTIKYNISLEDPELLVSSLKSILSWIFFRMQKECIKEYVL